MYWPLHGTQSRNCSSRPHNTGSLRRCTHCIRNGICQRLRLAFTNLIIPRSDALFHNIYPLSGIDLGFAWRYVGNDAEYLLDWGQIYGRRRFPCWIWMREPYSAKKKKFVDTWHSSGGALFRRNKNHSQLPSFHHSLVLRKLYFSL